MGQELQERRATLGGCRESLVAEGRDRHHAVTLDPPGEPRRLGMARRPWPQDRQPAVRFRCRISARHQGESGTDARLERSRRLPPTTRRRPRASLWRPLHEIDGGWFWWTDDRAAREHRRALAVHVRPLHQRAEPTPSDLGLFRVAPLRQRRGRCDKRRDAEALLPRFDYVDIVGIDIYPSEYIGIGKPQEDTYTKSFNVMKQVALGKMIALCRMRSHSES